jgi:hypothetical protein
MEKFTVNGRTYEVMAMPPYCAPLARRLGVIMQQNSVDLANTKQIYEEAKEITNLILAEGARPTEVHPEDINAVYNKIVNLTNAANKQAGLFRGPSKRPGDHKPSGARTSVSEETQRTSPGAPGC